MSVKQLMDECCPVIPGDEKWETTIEFVMEQDAYIMAALIEDAKTVGFREPVSIYRYDEDDYAIVTDGTHRVVAAYLAGIETIEVEDQTDAQNVARKVNADSSPLLVTEVKMNEDFYGDVDDLGMVVRSFPLGASDWVSAYDREEVEYGHLDITWDRIIDVVALGNDGVTALGDAITAAVIERISAVYGEGSVESVSTFLRY